MLICQHHHQVKVVVEAVVEAVQTVPVTGVECQRGAVDVKDPHKVDAPSAKHFLGKSAQKLN